MFIHTIDSKFQTSVNKACDAIRSSTGWSKGAILRFTSVGAVAAILLMAITCRAGGLSQKASLGVFVGLAIGMALECVCSMFSAKRETAETAAFAQGVGPLAKMAGILFAILLALKFALLKMPEQLTTTAYRVTSISGIVSMLCFVLFGYVILTPHRQPPKRRKEATAPGRLAPETT